MSPCSSFPFPLNPPVSLNHYKLHVLSPLLPFSKPSFSLSLSKSHICFSSSFPNPSTPDRDDILWLREEQRWLREEQRWLREEQRWIRERESLLAEIQSLKLQIQALEKQISAQDVELVPEEAIANVRALLQVLTERNRIAASASSPSPVVLEEKVEDVKKEVIKDLEREDDKARKTLRKGSGGDEVREMQVCSQ